MIALEGILVFATFFALIDAKLKQYFESFYFKKNEGFGLFYLVSNN